MEDFPHHGLQGTFRPTMHARSPGYHVRRMMERHPRSLLLHAAEVAYDKGRVGADGGSTTGEGEILRLNRGESGIE